MKKLFNEFKEFAFRGNVLDMAIGIMIGGAITAIVTSLVEDIFMPVISIFTGKIDFSTLAIQIGSGDFAAKIYYGKFITAIINFLLIALCVFFVLKLLVKMKKPEVKVDPRKCPYCFGDIHEEATRCMHCGAEVPHPEKK